MIFIETVTSNGMLGYSTLKENKLLKVFSVPFLLYLLKLTVYKVTWLESLAHIVTQHNLYCITYLLFILRLLDTFTVKIK